MTTSGLTDPPSQMFVVGGPPCQRTSVAAAITGNRTGETLWPEMLRIVDRSQCDWAVVEQPPGNPAWEGKVAIDLARLGLHVARVEFSARDLGAPHIRRRVFLLANASLSRLEVAWSAIPREIDRFARGAASRNPWLSGVPRGLRVADGPPYRLDRTDRITAIGDSNPPGMTTVIGRAILLASELTPSERAFVEGCLRRDSQQ